MAWVMSLVSVSSLTMAGLCWESGCFAGMALAAAWAAARSRRAAVTGACSLASVALVIMTLVPGAGLRRAARFASRAVWALARVFFAVLTAAAAVFFAGVRDHPAGVLGGDGVSEQGVQGEMGAAVAEVVLLPPPGGSPVDDGGGGQVRGQAGGQDVHLAGVAGLAAGDLPQGQHAAFMLAVADSQGDGGVSEVVGVLAAVVAGAGSGRRTRFRAGRGCPCRCRSCGRSASRSPRR